MIKITVFKKCKISEESWVILKMKNIWLAYLYWNKANHKDSNKNNLGNGSRDVVEEVCGAYDKNES